MNRKCGAIFDWDGVIINSAPQHETSWERLAKECGKALPENHFKRGFGMKNESIIPDLLGWTSAPVEVRLLSLRKEAIYREVVREQGMTALPGVESWLQLMREAKIPCVIASSTHRENITTTLEVLGLGDFFRGHYFRGRCEAGQARSRGFSLGGATDWRRAAGRHRF